MELLFTQFECPLDANVEKYIPMHGKILHLIKARLKSPPYEPRVGTMLNPLILSMKLDQVGENMIFCELDMGVDYRQGFIPADERGDDALIEPILNQAGLQKVIRKFTEWHNSSSHLSVPSSSSSPKNIGANIRAPPPPPPPLTVPLSVLNDSGSIPLPRFDTASVIVVDGATKAASSLPSVEHIPASSFETDADAKARLPVQTLPLPLMVCDNKQKGLKRLRDVTSADEQSEAPKRICVDICVRKDEWMCGACTVINRNTRKFCSVCRFRKPQNAEESKTPKKRGRPRKTVVAANETAATVDRTIVPSMTGGGMEQNSYEAKERIVPMQSQISFPHQPPPPRTLTVPTSVLTDPISIPLPDFSQTRVPILGSTAAAASTLLSLAISLSAARN